MDLPIVLSHKTAWLYHNVARPSEPLSRASSLYDEDSLANEAEPTASLPKLGLNAKGLRASTAVEIVTDIWFRSVFHEKSSIISTRSSTSILSARRRLDLGATCLGRRYLQAILSRWQRAFWWLMRSCALSKRVRG